MITPQINPQTPYLLPPKLEPDLAAVLAYWQGLERGEAAMPFWDDVNLSALPRLAGRLMMIDVREKPLRFRCGFGAVGEDIKRQYGGDLDGKFLDEIEVRHPLQFLNSQSSAAVECRAPTHYRHPTEKNYSRLVLPLWGDGHIGMLLGAFVWG